MSTRFVLDLLQRLEVEPLDEPAVQIDLELVDRAEDRRLEREPNVRPAVVRPVVGAVREVCCVVRDVGRVLEDVTAPVITPVIGPVGLDRSAPTWSLGRAGAPARRLRRARGSLAGLAARAWLRGLRLIATHESLTKACH